MRKELSYFVLIAGLAVGLSAAFRPPVASAQQATAAAPSQEQIYCSGLITDQKVPDNLYVISGENARYKTTFQPGDFVYINAGQEQGVKAGDQFEVMRPSVDGSAATPWFKFQAMLSRAMGTRYSDVGRLRVLHVDAKISTTQMTFGCGMMQRGDIVRPFAARPVPQFHDVKLDPFAPPSGKKTAMVVSGKDFAVLGGPGRIVYVNLGSAQGVKVGDYFRVFRYQGTHDETVFQVRDTAYKAYGFGSAPAAYEWNNLPRQILGEGIVLRTGPNSSNVELTNVRYEIYAGDYVELE